jgi:hypothetical protein
MSRSRKHFYDSKTIEYLAAILSQNSCLNRRYDGFAGVVYRAGIGGGYSSTQKIGA